MNIDWSEIPLSYNYAAMDKSGAWFVYKTKPTLNGRCWQAEDYKPISKHLWIVHPNYKNSLLQRINYEDLTPEELVYIYQKEPQQATQEMVRRLFVKQFIREPIQMQS